MTVAAVILAATRESALRAVEGVPNARRLADAAWAGGALPVIVVAHDPAGEVAAALAGSEAILVEPAPPEAGPVGQIVRGVEAAAATVAGTAAALVWPARMGWVDAETVTSLIEAHGVEPRALLRPAFRGVAGWPALVPLAELPALRTVLPTLMPDEVLAALASSVASRLIELGDPGVTHDLDTTRDALPPFEGPAEPASGHAHEWGAPAADRPDDAPMDLGARASGSTAEASRRGP